MKPITALPRSKNQPGDKACRPTWRCRLSAILPFLFLAGSPNLWTSPGSVQAWAATEKIQVAASIVPLGDFCAQIGGDRVTVQVLIPPGASPHTFDPPPSVSAKVARARLFVYVGAGMEPWAERLLKAGARQETTVVEAVQGLPLLWEADLHIDPKPDREKGHAQRSGPPSDRQSHPAAGHRPHVHGQGNPHVWLDPVLAQDICRRLAAALIQADPGHRAVYEANLQRYLKDLTELDQEIHRRVAQFTLRDYVCFHPAFTYFARRYGLREVGVIEAAPGREPTPRHIKELVGAIRRHGVRVVFAEPQLSARVAEVIAREAGIKVMILDPLGGIPPYGDNYLRLMRHNLAILAEGMQ